MRLFNTSLNLPRGVLTFRVLMLQTLMIAAFTAVTTAALTACGQATGPYDLVINQGRVIDPESGDHVRTLVEAGLSGPSLGVP